MKKILKKSGNFVRGKKWDPGTNDLLSGHKMMTSCPLVEKS